MSVYSPRMRRRTWQKLTIFELDKNLQVFDENGLPTVTKEHDTFLWAVTINRNDTIGKFLQVKCTPVAECKYWECDCDVKIGIINGKKLEETLVTNHKFTNCNNMSLELPIDENEDENKYGLIFDVKQFLKYRFTNDTSFDEKVENISDVKLIVEGQTLWACKKILAQYSAYFYDLFYGDKADKELKEYEIKKTTCNNFRMFLGLLYGNDVAIKLSIFQSIAELSFRFKADHCLEECEKFLINTEYIGNGLRLKYAQGYNFKVLHDYILETYKTVESVLDFEKDENYEFFGAETKTAMFERMVEIKRGAKFETIWLHDYGAQVNTVFGEPWRSSYKNNYPTKLITIERDIDDYLNQWKSRIEVEFRDEDCDSLAYFDYLLSNSNSRETASYNNQYYSCLRIQIYPIYGVHERRSTSFQEIRPNLTDVVLSVADKKFHVSKQILASQSSYFERMFYSDFVENGKEEIELKEIDAMDFETFLQMVYHPNRLITADTIEGLLKLSQMYDAKRVFQKCEVFLKLSNSCNKALKIKLAEKYNFTFLFEQLISNIKTYDDFKKLSSFEEFEELKDDTIGKIARNVLKIT